MEKREKTSKNKLKTFNNKSCSATLIYILVSWLDWAVADYRLRYISNQSIIMKTNNKRSICWPLDLKTIIVLKH